MTPPAEALLPDQPPAEEPLHPESLHRALGLTDDEFEAVAKILGRPPNHLELALYAVMWSEHCSYKSSRLHLRRLPTEGPRVLVGPGENAGVIDAGDGIAVAIRIESHNHPSAIEPYQGAATGVGGILRDIFTMGARPLAVMDPLFFGRPDDDPRQRWLVEGVVSGISGYGNSVGVPTVGGELTFDPCYAQNPLVNVLCMGALPVERLVLGIASGPGNLAVLLGSSTGRDGIGGVSVLASAGFSGDQAGVDDDTKRPSVQVGDPFEEKRLIEACLELLDTKLVVGNPGSRRRRPGVRDQRDRGPGRRRHGRRRDRGAPAGGGHGALGGDDQREPGAHARHRHARVVAGGGGHLRQVGGAGHGRRHGDGARPRRRGAPAHPRRERGPRARRRAGRVAFGGRAALRPSPPGARVPPQRAAGRARRLRRRPPRAAARSRLGLPPVRPPAVLEHGGGPRRDAALLRLAGPGLPVSARGVALTTDSNPRACALDPRAGTALALAEAVANLACVGATPAAVVNCLNFGNPEHPEVMWQLSECIDGLAESCRALSLPVIGGNVSFYNESGGSDIDPTPVLGVLGLVDDVHAAPPGLGWSAGDAIVLVGRRAGADGSFPLEGTRWATERREHRTGRVPAVDFGAHAAVCAFVAGLVAEQVGGASGPPLLHAVHDISGGGLAVALAEMSARAGVGCTLDLADPAEMFTELPSRFVVATATPDELAARAADLGIPVEVLGRAGGERLVLGGLVDLPVDAVRSAHEGNLALALGDP